jgi:stalled ribosome rescue protein Dom34
MSLDLGYEKYRDMSWTAVDDEIWVGHNVPQEALKTIEQLHHSLPWDHEIMPTHAVIWIDHKEARIFHVHPEATDETTVLAPQHHFHRHPKGRGEAREHPDDAHRFFGEVARTLAGVDAILIVGPSSAKLEFFKYLHEHERRLESKVVDIESADHPTDGEIIARAKSYFKAGD